MTRHDVEQVKMILTLLMFVATMGWGVFLWLKRRRMARWMRIQGTVEKVMPTVVRHNLRGAVTRLDFTVAYSILGVRYVTHRFDPMLWSNTMNEGAARRLQEAYPAGSAIDLWVSPSKPEVAYIRRTPLGVVVLATFLGPALVAMVLAPTVGVSLLSRWLGDDDHAWWTVLVTEAVLAVAVVGMLVEAFREPRRD
jgi:hypothetical protein